MNNTFNPGLAVSSRFATSRPPIPGNHHVRDEQVDRPLVLSGDTEGFAPLACQEHPVAISGKHSLDDLPHGALVLHHEHRFVSLQRRRGGSGGQDLDLPFNAREVDLEGRTHSDFAVDAYVAVALLHDAVHHGEPQSRPLASLLGGEERFEDAVPDLPGDPRARVADRQEHMGARDDGGMLLREGFVEDDVVGLQDQCPPGGHRVPRVHR